MSAGKREREVERMNAVRRLLTHKGRQRVPLVLQLGATDCGPAALTMVLGFFGKHLSLAEVRKSLRAGRDGVDAAAIVRAARSYGLRGRGVRVEVDALSHLPAGAILYWQFRHFVVYERTRSRHVDIVDPAFGRRSIPFKQFRECFTGVALVFEPSESFVKGDTRKTPVSRWLLQILDSRVLILRILTASIVAQVAVASAPLITRIVIDRVIPQSNASLLMKLFIGYCAFELVGVLASFVRAHLLIYLKTHVETNFTLRFLDHLMDLPYSFFQQHTTGDLMLRLSSNDVIRDLLTTAAISSLLDGATAILYCILLFAANARLAVCAMTLAFLRLCLLTVVRLRQKRLLEETLEMQGHLQTYQVEMLEGMETLKAMGMEVRASEHWVNLFIRGVNISVRRGRLDAAFDGSIGVIGSATTMIFLFYGTYIVLQGRLTLGAMVSIIALAAGLLTPLNNLITTVLQLQIAEIYLNRINDVLDTAPEQELRTTLAPASIAGRVTLNKVTFRYTDQGPAVVDEVTFTVSPGSRIALVGHSGCGKSTVARLLAGLYKPSSGSILYDSLRLDELNLRNVRSQIGIVTQDTQLFGGTIRRNIALSEPEMAIGRVIAAAKSACIHEEIMMMPMGYETVLTDRGLSLSGGQRQRLALARALANNPKLLILDEATSNLDALTEERVNRKLASLRCTRIIIAHRLSTIRGADMIVVFEGGRIVEQGRHDELVGSRGVYFGLISAQQDERSPERKHQP